MKDVNAGNLNKARSLDTGGGRGFLGSESGLTCLTTVILKADAAVFGDRLEAGQNLEQDQLDSLQEVFDRFSGAARR